MLTTIMSVVHVGPPSHPPSSKTHPPRRLPSFLDVLDSEMCAGDSAEGMAAAALAAGLPQSAVDLALGLLTSSPPVLGPRFGEHGEVPDASDRAQLEAYIAKLQRSGHTKLDQLYDLVVSFARTHSYSVAFAVSTLLFVFFGGESSVRTALRTGHVLSHDPLPPANEALFEEYKTLKKSWDSGGCSRKEMQTRYDDVNTRFLAAGEEYMKDHPNHVWEAPAYRAGIAFMTAALLAKYVTLQAVQSWGERTKWVRSREAWRTEKALYSAQRTLAMNTSDDA